jgi:cation diffusion facilitator family transporter
VAARPADRDHPYGHGKVEFFSAGIEGSLILLAALLILWEAGREIWLGPSVRNLDSGLLLLVPFSVANGVLGAYLVRVGRRTRSVALVADGKHVLTDVWTSAAVIVGLLAVRFTGWVILDPLVAILAAANILREGFNLLRGAVRGLMDEAEPESLAALAGALESARTPDWIDVHGLRAWRSGAFLHADFHMTVPRYLDVEQVHEIHESIQNRLRVSTDMAGDFVIHFDPCRPFHCSGCERAECPVRVDAFDERELISVESATRNADQRDTGFGPA